MTEQFLNSMITLNQQFVINKTTSLFMLLPTKNSKVTHLFHFLLQTHGDMAVSDLDKANTLNSVFHNAVITDNGQDLHFYELCNITKMNNVEVTADDITTALANMSNKIFTTPDEIPAYFIKQIAAWIIDVPCHLYQLVS